MDVYDAIRQRRSVRKFEDRAIADDVLARILDAGILAPTGRNTQEWKYVVVREPEARNQLAGACEQEFVGKAQVVVAVVSLDPVREMYCGIQAGPVDCAIVIDHMTLAAVAEGLGSCWIGHFDQDKCRTILDVPESAKIIEMLVLGYPADTPTEKKRKSPEELTCWEKFS
ncbi:MAG: nitroreductase family protein [Phycisphaerae bacterium]|jgi:nitroreductase|nr:nitroreductase family protein [Phycisphaerae bacterium]